MAYLNLDHTEEKFHRVVPRFGGPDRRRYIQQMLLAAMLATGAILAVAVAMVMTL